MITSIPLRRIYCGCLYRTGAGGINLIEQCVVCFSIAVPTRRYHFEASICRQRWSCFYCASRFIWHRQFVCCHSQSCAVAGGLHRRVDRITCHAITCHAIKNIYGVTFFLILLMTILLMTLIDAITSFTVITSNARRDWQRSLWSFTLLPLCHEFSHFWIFPDRV